MSTRLKLLCLIDAIGAVFSVFGHVVLSLLPAETVGLPKWFLVSCAGAAGLLALNSFRCWATQPAPSWRQLRTIGLLNIAYCAASLSTVAFVIQSLTPLGKAYILIEAGVVLPLAIFEIYVAKQASDLDVVR